MSHQDLQLLAMLGVWLGFGLLGALGATLGVALPLLGVGTYWKTGSLLRSLPLVLLMPIAVWIGWQILSILPFFLPVPPQIWL